jgi:hypothetical protein
MRSALLAVLALAISAASALAQPRDPRPDLAIAGIVTADELAGSDHVVNLMQACTL